MPRKRAADRYRRLLRFTAKRCGRVDCGCRKIAFRAEKTTFREKSPPFFAVWYIMYLYKSVYSVLLNSFLQNLQNGEADTFDFDLFLEEHRT